MIVKSQYIPDKNVTVYMASYGSKFICSYNSGINAIAPDDPMAKYFFKEYESAKRWKNINVVGAKPLTKKQADERYYSLIKVLSNPSIAIEVN